MSITGQRVVVTGASGLMGFPIAQALCAANEVIAVARYTDAGQADALRALGAEVVSFDLLDEDLSALPEQADVVLHLGARVGGGAPASYMREYFDANAQATGRLMNRYRNSSAFVYASTGSSYAYQGERPLTEDDPPGLHNGLELYAASKIAGEEIVRYLAADLGLASVILRIFSLYGPRGGAISSRIDQVAAGHPVALYPGVKNRYNPMYESDYVEKAIASLRLASTPPEIINFAGSETSSIEEYCAIAGELLGRVPVFTETTSAIYPIWPDVTKMDRLLGPTKVSVADGVRLVVEAGPARRTTKWSTYTMPD